jgi:DNA-binding FadR family transcriptional regulator
VSKAKIGETVPPWETGEHMQQLVTQAVKTLANEIFERVISSTYSFGTRLPAERYIAEEFNLSRNTVRQALDLLESHNIISRRPGSGSFVIYRIPQSSAAHPQVSEEFLDDNLAEITSPLELNVARSIFEPEIVRLATINMTVRDFAILETALLNLEKVTTNAKDFAYWDEQFHMAIAAGTHNPLLIAINNLISHVRRHAHWSISKDLTLSPNRIHTYQNMHRSIYEALVARDIEAVVEFTKLHMTEVQRDLMHDT